MAWRKSWSKLNIFGINGNGKCKKRQLSPAERSVLDDYLDLAEISLIRGKVCIAHNIGYTQEQLAQILYTPVEVIKVAEEKLVRNATISINNRVILINNWHTYQSEYERQRKYRVTNKGYKQRLHKSNTKKASVSVSISDSISVSSKEKILYREYVYLLREEYEKLLKELGESCVESLITDLNNYLGSTGRQYKSHYHTILAWARKEIRPKPTEPQKRTMASFKRLDEMEAEK